MCDYCEHDKTMITVDVIDRANFGFGYDNEVRLTLREAETDPSRIAMFIDRGYLRLVDINDCSCMDSGQKIKIGFCPICGNKIE